MANYSGIQKEETLKSLVHEDYFPKFGYEPNIDNIDFVITDKKARNDLFSACPGSSRHFLWAEAKKGIHDVFDMFTQLALTCKKTYEKAEHLAPPWLGAFDEARISFVAFHDMLPIFTETDFNWNVAPSSRETADFQKAKEKVKNLIGAKMVVYTFGADDRDIKEFIKTHFTADGSASIKSPITKDNFVQIFIKWVKEVKPYINISKSEWTEFKQKGILDCDFYRADMMSAQAQASELGENASVFSTKFSTITEKLKIVLKNDNYKFQENISGRLFTSDIGFTDSGVAYTRFWNKYERPPAPVYQQFIIDRRDLLVPQNIREVKGSFFTPKIWADKSKEYLAAVFGDNWQEEYYIWDCAAGTGNLLAGLANKYNLWASDIEQGNVETMQSLIDIDENLNLLPGHVFQFDFLNDSFDKLPEGLKKIIDDPEKRKKLIVYINPPYAENGAGVGKGAGKAGVSSESKIYYKYTASLGRASRELFTQFFIRIYVEIEDCKIAAFSKLKYINAPNFVKFRTIFNAEYLKGFICRANTFDNVDGNFPISFLVWNLENKRPISSIECDILDNNGNVEGKKNYYSYHGHKYINDWISDFTVSKDIIGTLFFNSNDFQHQKFTYLSLIHNAKSITAFPISLNNILTACIYFSVRLCIDISWLNDRDQFLFPNDKYNPDIEFQNNCLIYTLFHSQNRIKSEDGVNNWTPYAEKQVDAKEKFESNFMSEFLKGKTFSTEAQTILDAGRELWKYYHAKIKNDKTASVNASFYDIREYFQGRNENGTMNAKSADETYNALIAALRAALKTLAAKIAPKVYEYGFLKE
ncbi:MAG: hypothetical protein LBC53_05650 [Spirochaetaceae bacterium]|jgi:hypothetical protein|nr:hypothetical protein [Spirochaetaceae bacterium]